MDGLLINVIVSESLCFILFDRFFEFALIFFVSVIFFMICLSFCFIFFFCIFVNVVYNCKCLCIVSVG